MAKIPEFIWEPLNSAFPANVALIGTPMPDGFVQISPRGSILVYDDETIAFWSRGRGRTHESRYTAERKEEHRRPHGTATGCSW